MNQTFLHYIREREDHLGGSLRKNWLTGTNWALQCFIWERKWARRENYLSSLLCATQHDIKKWCLVALHCCNWSWTISWTLSWKYSWVIIAAFFSHAVKLANNYMTWAQIFFPRSADWSRRHRLPKVRASRFWWVRVVQIFCFRLWFHPVWGIFDSLSQLSCMHSFVIASRFLMLKIMLI